MYRVPRRGSAKVTALIFSGGGCKGEDCPAQWVAFSDAWRDETSKTRTVQATRIRIEYPFGNSIKQANSLSKQLSDGSAVQLKGQWEVRRGFRCLIVEQRPKLVEDSLLASIQAMQETPTIVQHASLGKLTYRPEMGMGMFEGRVSWGRKRISLTVDGDGVGNLAFAAAFVERLLKNQQRWSKELQEVGEGPLYEQYLEWQGYETPLTSRQLWRTLTVRSIDLKRGGIVSFWLSAREGHGVHEGCARFFVESRKFIDYYRLV